MAASATVRPKRGTMELFGISASEAAIIAGVALVILGPHSMVHIARALLSLRQWVAQMKTQIASTAVGQNLQETSEDLSAALNLKELQEEIEELKKQLHTRQ